MSWYEFREPVWLRDKGICQICMKPVDFGPRMHLDHIVQRCEGGSDEMGNLRTTHARCNVGRPKPPPERRVVVVVLSRRGEELVQQSIRYTKRLKEQLDQIADEERRSVNTVIVMLLEEGVEKYGKKKR